MDDKLTNHRSEDRHRSRFMFRLPEIFREKLQALKARTGKPMTRLLIEALTSFLKKFGMWSRRDEQRLEAEMGGEAANP